MIVYDGYQKFIKQADRKVPGEKKCVNKKFGGYKIKKIMKKYLQNSPNRLIHQSLPYKASSKVKV